MKFKNKIFKKAFTLVELVVVIAVIAILTGISVGAYVGVTDNANRSNALVTQTEVKNLWQTFLVSDYDSSQSLAKNAEYFCLKYYPENNGTTNLNYKEISLNSSSSVSNRISPKYENDESINNGILLKVESNYPSYLLTNSNGYVIETSSISKNEKEFKSSIDNSSNISDKDKTIFNNNESKDVLEIQDVKDENGKTQRGYKYIQVNINDQVYYVKNKDSLASTYPNLIPSLINLSSDSSITSYGYDYEYTLDNKYYDVSSSIKSDSNEGVLKRDSSYDYIIDTIILKRIENTKTSTISFNDFPILVKQGDNQYYFKDFLSLINADKDEKYNFSIENNNKYNYIFVGNTTLYNDFTLPSNYILVVDNFDVTSQEVKNYASYYNSSDSFSKINDSENDSRLQNIKNSWKQGYGSAQGVNTFKDVKYTFTINEGVTLNLNNNSKLDILATLNIGEGNGGFSLPSYSILENNGVINVNNGAIYRSLGVSNGSGKINALNGSIIYEIFKITDFKGGSISYIYNSEKIFPFSLYYIDNIQCDLYLNYGTSYKYIANLWANSSYQKMCFTFISSKDGLFIFNSEDSLIKKNVENGKTNIILEKGNLIDNAINLSFTALSILVDIKINIKSTDFIFPLNNFNFTFKNGTTTTISKNKFYLLNTSSINVEEGATLNLKDNSYIIDAYMNDETIGNTITEADKYDGGSETEKGWFSSTTYSCFVFYLDFYKNLKELNNETNYININGTFNGNFYSNLDRVKSDNYDLTNDSTKTNTYKNFIALYNNKTSTNTIKYTTDISSLKVYYTYSKVSFALKQTEVIE